MESSQENSCSVIQYYKGTDSNNCKSNVIISNSVKNNNSVEQELKEVLTQNNGETINESLKEQIPNHDREQRENSVKIIINNIDQEQQQINKDSPKENDMGVKSENTLQKTTEVLLEASQHEKNKEIGSSEVKSDEKNHKYEDDAMDSDDEPLRKGRKRHFSDTPTDGESLNTTKQSVDSLEANEEPEETEDETEDEEMENKPRKRGRTKKNPDVIPSHLSADVVLAYKILLKFFENPQFSCFHKALKKNATNVGENGITCLDQIKKKFNDNSYQRVCEFVNDVREMLVNIYESRNPVSIKRALRLEQILEQRIAQLPNYLRPQCALILSPDEVNNSNKIRITKGGGFVSLLLEKTEKERTEKNREKRKLLAEERKQLKEEQDKDVQDWEKNVLLKDVEEEIKSMWELPVIGQFIHLCAELLNIGEVAQYEVERMVLMPQCSDTLDLVMTSLLTNSIVRAKLDRTPSMPYSVWGPLVRTKVVSWYRAWQREGRNENKLFEEVGVEPDFWQVLGPDRNPLDYYYFHELSLLQRVWILKTLCDVDFVKKKTVYENIRAQPLDEMNPVYLGVDRHGYRYIHFKQFGATDIRIYRQNVVMDEDIAPSELVESAEGFEHREGPITTDKVFKDIWEVGDKTEKFRKKKKQKKDTVFHKAVSVSTEKKNLRKSVRAKQKTYADWSDSDQSDTDLYTLRNKLRKADPQSLYRPIADKEFISLSFFRLSKEKTNNKVTGKKSSYCSKRTEDACKNETTTNDKTMIEPKVEPEEAKEDANEDENEKMQIDVKKEEKEDEGEDGKDEAMEETKEEDPKSGFENEQTDLLETKPKREEVQNYSDKICQDEETIKDDVDLEDENVAKFTVKNLNNLKMVLQKGGMKEEKAPEMESANLDTKPAVEIKTEKDVEEDVKGDSSYEYTIPKHLKPDSNKFYLVVDSVEGLRQFISKFGSHENDLEIITRSTKSKKRKSQAELRNTSCEVKLIERLQSLLLELEPWELDLIKSFRSNREKMYKEYMNFMNRPPDFVHPNEAYWTGQYEEPVSSTGTTTAITTTTTTTTTATIADGSGGNLEKTGGKEDGTTEGGESVVGNSAQPESTTDELGPRKRTRVTRVQLQPENDDLDEDFDDIDDCESNGSDDIWVLPTPKKKPKKEASVKTPKLPKKLPGRKPKSAFLEKMEIQSHLGEKSTSSPEKSKKTLFWGPRSSDPSEDLNWETNRQKILEQHNSPVKKVYEHDDGTDRSEYPTTSVITGPQRRFFTQIPGNKKPYYSTAQLKAMDTHAKQRKIEEQHRALARIGSPIQDTIIIGGITGPIASTSAEAHSSISKPSKAPKTPRRTPPKSPKSPKSQSAGRGKGVQKLPIPRPEATILHHTLTYPGQIKVQTTGQMTNVIQTIEGLGIKGGVIQQAPITQAQLEQSVGQVQQIQIQPAGQARAVTATGTVRLEQPVQWPSKVINLQTVGQTTKVVEQPQEVQSQTQTQQQQQQQQQETQAQVQIQTQPGIQIQGQLPQVHLSPVQSSMQLASDKLPSVQQMIVQQNQGLQQALGTDSDLYITDGKLLIKFDNSFVSNYMNKEKFVALNEKLDLKKPLLIVKPKTDSDAAAAAATAAATAGQTIAQAQAQAIASTSQQSIIVLNKPGCIQQGAVATTVPNFVISGNYIIKDGSQVLPQGSQAQGVKIVQPAPAYVIQQKPIVGKDSQPQIIKIIPTQQMAANQNIILTAGNLSVGSPVICPVNQTVVTGDQQNKPGPTLRLLRPSIPGTSTPGITGPNRVTTVQSPIIVNNVMHIQGQRMEGPRPQTGIVGGRIVSTGVPTVRMAAPTVIPSTSGTQTVRLVKTSSAQPVKVATAVQTRHAYNPATGAQNAQSIGPTTIINAQPVRIVASLQGQQTQPQIVVPSSGLNAQATTSTCLINVQPVNSNSQSLLTYTVASSGVLPASGAAVIQTSQPVGIESTQSMSIASSVVPGSNELTNATVTHPAKNITNSEAQTAMTSNSQVVKVVTIAQSQHIQTPTIVSSGNAAVNVQIARTVPSTVVQSARSSTSTIVQPVKQGSSGKSHGVKIIPNHNAGVKLVATPIKGTVITSSASTLPILSPGMKLVATPVKGTVITSSSLPSPILSPGMKLVATPIKGTVITSSASTLPAVKPGRAAPSETTAAQPVRVQTIVKPGGAHQEGSLKSG